MVGNGASLRRLFSPKSVALVGATERSIWSVSAYNNLERFEFPGAIFPINPKGGVIHGRTAAPSCAAVGKPIDAALLMVPEAGLLSAIEDLREAKVGGAVVLSSGFAEAGAAGAQKQQAVRDAARAAGIRLLGPNCLGFANFAERSCLFTTPLRRPMPDATIALVSQSGALASQIEQFAYQQRIAFTHLISTGNEADVTIADALDYLLEVSDAASIALFVETVRDPSAFADGVMRANAAGKTVVVLKAGSSPAAAAAAQAHTGSLVGDDRVFDALCRDLGVVRVRSLEELVITTDLASRLPRPRKEGIGLVAMSGGLCEIALDQADRGAAKLPTLTPATREALASALPSFATPNNPLDVTGAAMLQPDLLTASIKTMAQDPQIGLTAFVFDIPLKPDARGFIGKVLACVAAAAAASDEPVVMMSHTQTPVSAEAKAAALAAGVIYTGGGVRDGLSALGLLAARPTALARNRQWSKHVQSSTQKPSSEREVLAFLATRGVATTPTELVTSADAAADAGRQMGFPVVLKIASPDIAHKTEVGGVALNVGDEDAVREAFVRIRAEVAKHAPDARIDGVIVAPMRKAGLELFVGTVRDPQWGPAIVVGLGGVFVEVLKDTSLRLLPVREADVLEMLSELRGSALLDGFRGSAGVDRAELAKAISAIGDAALALGHELLSLEVNPLLVTPDRAPEALDGLAIWEASHGEL